MGDRGVTNRLMVGLNEGPIEAVLVISGKDLEAEGLEETSEETELLLSGGE